MLPSHVRRHAAVAPVRLLPALPGALVTALTMALLAAPPAQAHPFGPPLTARLSVDGSDVRIAWTGAEDDWLILGAHVGAFTGEPSGVSGRQALSTSPEVRDYLLGSVEVSQPSGPCPARALPVRNLLGEGVPLMFACTGRPAELTVTVTVLTDVNGAYRTVLTADTGGAAQQLLFTADEPRQSLVLGAGRSLAPVATGGALLGATALAVLGGVLVLRRARAQR